MKPEQQRIAIAEACGWTWKQAKNSAHHTWHRPDGSFTTIPLWHTDPQPSKEVYGEEWLPDYLNDLNAMHEAEKVLTEEQHRRFSWHLVQVTDDNYRTWSAFEYDPLSQVFERRTIRDLTPSVWEMSLGDVQACLRATAAQRAEAFLRTLNLWTES